MEAPAARRKEPSAEKAREVKHWPEVLLLALRLSEYSRPPAMSLLPSIVPCTQQHLGTLGLQAHSKHLIWSRPACIRHDTDHAKAHAALQQKPDL